MIADNIFNVIVCDVPRCVPAYYNIMCVGVCGYVCVSVCVYNKNSLYLFFPSLLMECSQ